MQTYFFFISGRLAGSTLTFDFLSRVTIHFLYTVIPMLSKITVVDLVQNSPTVLPFLYKECLGLLIFTKSENLATTSVIPLLSFILHNCNTD